MSEFHIFCNNLERAKCICVDVYITLTKISDARKFPKSNDL